MENWHLFTNPVFQLHFMYPLITSHGHVVEKREDACQAIHRVHLISPKSQEVYFEVTRYPDLPSQEEYQRHKMSLEKRFTSDKFDISELKEGKLGGLLVQQYRFKWNQGVREVVLIQHKQATYRVLYDPQATINLQILATIVLAD